MVTLKIKNKHNVRYSHEYILSMGSEKSAQEMPQIAPESIGLKNPKIWGPLNWSRNPVRKGFALYACIVIVTLQKPETSIPQKYSFITARLIT